MPGCYVGKATKIFLALLAVLAFTISVYIMSRPRPVYLIDFACYKPADELKVYTYPRSSVISFHLHASTYTCPSVF